MLGGMRWPDTIDEFEGHLLKLDWSHQTPSRRRILSAFLQLATEHGFNSVSMRMIAAEVNIKAPSIYAHFPEGRDEIVAESLRWHFYRFGMAVVDEIRGVGDPAEGVRCMVKVHVSRQLALPESNLWDLLVATDALVHFFPDDLRQEVDAWVERYEELFRAAAVGVGCIAPVQQVKVVMTLLEGANRWAMWDGKQKSIPRCVDMATDLAFSLLATKSD